MSWLTAVPSVMCSFAKCSSMWTQGGWLGVSSHENPTAVSWATVSFPLRRYEVNYRRSYELNYRNDFDETCILHTDYSQACFQHLRKAYADPTTEVYLMFYQAVLRMFVEFNKFLQREDPLICVMLKQLNSFLKTCSRGLSRLLQSKPLKIYAVFHMTTLTTNCQVLLLNSYQ